LGGYFCYGEGEITSKINRYLERRDHNNGPVLMKLNFNQQGQPQSSVPAVILLHGLFGSLSNLAGVAKALSDNFCVYQLDLRNHGTSPHDGNMTYPDMANDIIEFMDDHDIQRAHILGHSMGGKVAMQVALNHPERLLKLIVADIAPVTYTQHHNPALDGLQALSQINLESRKQADEKLSHYINEQPVRAFLLKNLYREPSGLYKLRLNLPAILNHYESVRETLTGKAFSNPTLFLKGSESAYIQQKHKETILSLFPNAKIKVISGVGHWLHSEKPETFNRLVVQFLSNP